jgi:hypothetical protein
LFCGPSLATLGLRQRFVDTGFRVAELLFVHFAFFVVEVEIQRVLHKSIGRSNAAALNLFGNAL